MRETIVCNGRPTLLTQWLRVRRTVHGTPLNERLVPRLEASSHHAAGGVATLQTLAFFPRK